MTKPTTSRWNMPQSDMSLGERLGDDMEAFEE